MTKNCFALSWWLGSDDSNRSRLGFSLSAQHFPTGSLNFLTAWHSQGGGTSHPVVGFSQKGHSRTREVEAASLLTSGCGKEHSKTLSSVKGALLVKAVREPLQIHRQGLD